MTESGLATSTHSITPALQKQENEEQEEHEEHEQERNTFKETMPRTTLDKTIQKGFEAKNSSLIRIKRVRGNAGSPHSLRAREWILASAT